MDRKFLVMWCNEGLECVIDITDEVGMMLFDALASRSNGTKIGHTVNSMMMRARYNPQRHYEIYSVTAVDSITKEDLEEMFTQAPQTAVDIIREKGVQLYSDRASRKQVVIV